MTVVTRHERPAMIRVAIVDDHRLVVDGLVAHLGARRNGIKVVIGTSSWQALLAHPEFPVDVAVLDLNGEDSLSIMTKVQILTAAGTQTIVMSRHEDPSTIRRAIAAGALAFVPKTDTADVLVSAIKSASIGERYSHSPLTGRGISVVATKDPGLGKQELRSLVLYSAGRSIRDVARDMGTTEETVKSYIKRGRRKYRDIGIDLGTKQLLRQFGIGQGWPAAEL